MPCQFNAALWNADEDFFSSKEIKPIKQAGPHCVSTVLSMLTNQKPEYFQSSINTQDPVSWSIALNPFGIKLAYCPSDCRKIKFYADELVKINDLFLLSYYTSKNNNEILADPNDQGWVCPSHIVILHKSKIIDPAQGNETNIYEHKSLEKHAKRIFRVVPNNHPRGI